MFNIRTMAKTHEIVELTPDGLLIIKSVLPRSEFEKGGSQFGYAYSYGVSKSMFDIRMKSKLGLSDEEYNDLLPKVTY